MTPRGIALVIVSGLLVTLLLVAAAFVRLGDASRAAPRSAVEAARASLLARSGAERALGELSRGEPAPYGGEDYDGDGVRSAGIETTAERFAPGVLDVATCPVEHALRPSFWSRRDGLRDSTGGVAPDWTWVEGVERGISGRLRGTNVDAVGHRGDTYVLRIDDESAKINVNGGFLDADDRDADGIPDHRDPDVRVGPVDDREPDRGRGWNHALARILDLLGSQPEVGVAGLGAAALAARPEGGYGSVADLERALGGGIILNPYVTVRSWVDRSVVHPNGVLTAAPLAIGDVKRGRVPLALEEGGRPPVNLNAAPRPVLVSLIDGLRAGCWCDPLVAPFVYEIPNPMLPGMSAAIADRIVERRRTDPFDSWTEFSSFCDSLCGDAQNTINWYGNVSASGGGNLAAADLLKANFDPNTASNKELPDQLRWRWVDKTDLLAWSTEGSLGPTGVFSVESFGRVTDMAGRLLAARRLRADVDVFRLLRHTSQSDFVAGRVPDGSASSVLSIAPAGGARTTGAGASWNAWGAGRGLEVLTYPSPPGALPGGACGVDGYLGLATVEEEPIDPPGGRYTFLHHFDDAWDADLGGAPARVGSPDFDPMLPTDPAAVPWPAAGAEPGTIYPDGVHSQWKRAPAFRAQGNLPATVSGPPSNHGAISYWVKPNLTGTWGPAYSYKFDVVCIRRPPGLSHALVVGRQAGLWGICVEHASVADGGGLDPRHERTAERHVTFPTNFGAQFPFPGLRWQLVTARFDTDETSGEVLRTDVRGVSGGGSSGGRYPDPYDIPSGEEIADATTILGLGVEWSRFGGLGTTSNQILDEVAICDFGDDSVAASAAAAALAQGRYSNGRYYKGDAAGNAGAFLSDVLEPASGGCRIVGVRWTAFFPHEDRAVQPRRWTEWWNIDPRAWSRPIDGGLVDFSSGAASPRAWLEIDLMDEAGQTVLEPLLSGAPVGPAAAARPLSRDAGRFRYRIRFRTSLGDPMNDPLLETPVLDDITFAWQPAAGPRVISWREG